MPLGKIRLVIFQKKGARNMGKIKRIFRKHRYKSRHRIRFHCVISPEIASIKDIHCPRSSGRDNTKSLSAMTKGGTI